VTSPWVLLLTDDPTIQTTAERLAESIGVGLRQPPVAGLGPPSLVLLGADRSGERALPAEASGVPRILISADEPSDLLWRAAMELRAEQVVLLPEAEHVLNDRLARLADQRARQALVIAVTGGCGGAGASVLAAALARAAASITRSLLIDLDRLGSGLDLLLGAEDEPGLRWPDLASARGRLFPGSLTGAVPVIDGIHVLSWDRSPDPIDLPASAVAAVLGAARHEYGVVVLDLPRSPQGLVGELAVAARSADLGLLVVPAEVRAAAAAHRLVGGLRELMADIRLVVRGPAPNGLRSEAISDALDLPLVGTLKPEPGLQVALERGEPPGLHSRGPLSALCRELLAHLLADARSAGWSSAR
jgi:secretion/DNA translocation related CpaE-like protein